jgi:hypothetical protein
LHEAAHDVDRSIVAIEKRGGADDAKVMPRLIRGSGGRSLHVDSFFFQGISWYPLGLAGCNQARSHELGEGEAVAQKGAASLHLPEHGESMAVGQHELRRTVV